ncbi:MAG: flippase [Candidatus Thorarchaeota archaeon]
MSDREKKRDLLELGRGSASSAIIQVFGAVFLYVYHIILARFLGASDYGIFSFSLSLSTIVIVISQMGMQTGALRFTSSSLANGNIGSFKGVLIRSHQLIIISGLSFLVIAFIVIKIFSNRFDSNIISALFLFMWLIPISGLMRVRQHILRGMKKIRLSLIPENIALPLLATIFIVVLYWGGSLNLRSSIISYIISNILCLILGWYYLSSSLSEDYKNAIPEYNTRELLKVSLPMMFSSMWQVFISRIDHVMIGTMLPMQEVGIYGAAVRTSLLIIFPATVVNAMLAPLISGTHAKDENERLQYLVTTSLRWIMYITLPVTLLFLLNGKLILKLYGSEFIYGSRAFLILVAAKSFSCIYGSVGYLLTMTGLQNKYAMVMIVSSFLNIAMNLYLIPELGIEGAAITSLVTTICWNFWMGRIVSSRKKIRAYYIPGLRLIGISIISIAVFYLFTSIISPYVGIASFIFTYGILVLVIGLEEDDRWLIGNIWKRGFYVPH